MEIFADFHTHTIYSDGKSTIEENIKSAIEKNLKIIGITDHGYKHAGFGVKYKNYPKIYDEINRLREKYPEILILLGCECNILDNTGIIDMDDKIRKYFDYIMAGYHFGSLPVAPRGLLNHARNYIKPFKKYEVDYNTKALIKAMEENELFILTHPGDKGDIDTIEVAKVAMKTNTILEINERHRNLTKEQINILKDMDLKYIISSDAHLAENVGKVDDAIKRAEILDHKKIVNIKGGYYEDCYNNRSFRFWEK